MSARSQSTPYFQSDEGLMAGHRVSDGQAMVAEEFLEDVCRQAPEDVPHIVRAFQDAYVQSMIALLRALHPLPTILFWFSVKAAGHDMATGTAREVLGTFPQLVTRDMIDTIRPCASTYVECISSRGLPRRIVTADGTPSSFVLNYRLATPEQYTIEQDSYYPSPEMHVSAAAALEPAIRDLLRGRGSVVRYGRWV